MTGDCRAGGAAGPGLTRKTAAFMLRGFTESKGETTMKFVALIIAVAMTCAVAPAVAGVAPNTGASAASQSGAKIAPKKNQETQDHEEHQPENAK